MKYRKNFEIWSIVINKYIKTQKDRERQRERYRERERDRETRKGQRERDRCRGEEIMRVLINNPFVMSLVKLVFSNFHLK